MLTKWSYSNQIDTVYKYIANLWQTEAARISSSALNDFINVLCSVAGTCSKFLSSTQLRTVIVPFRKRWAWVVSWCFLYLSLLWQGNDSLMARTCLSSVLVHSQVYTYAVLLLPLLLMGCSPVQSQGMNKQLIGETWNIYFFSLLLLKQQCHL